MIVLIPTWFSDDAAGQQRQAVWEHIRDRYWLPSGQAFITGTDDQAPPFSVARAVNNAAEVARLTYPGANLMVMGADHIPDWDVLTWSAHMLEQWPWTHVYRRIAYLSEQDTYRQLQGDYSYGNWVPTCAPCTGVVAMRRTAWDAAGGMDTDYEGWGYEDNQLIDDLKRTVGTGGPAHPTAILKELWHPNGHRDLGGPNAQLYAEKRRANR